MRGTVNADAGSLFDSDFVVIAWYAYQRAVSVPKESGSIFGGIHKA